MERKWTQCRRRKSSESFLVKPKKKSHYFFIYLIKRRLEVVSRFPPCMFCMLQTQIMFVSFETEQRRVHRATHSSYDVLFDAVNNTAITTNKRTLKNKTKNRPCGCQEYILIILGGLRHSTQHTFLLPPVSSEHAAFCLHETQSKCLKCLTAQWDRVAPICYSGLCLCSEWLRS